MSATLSSPEGTETFQQIHFDIDGDGTLYLEVDSESLKGPHVTAFQMLLPKINPDELESFGRDMVALAKEMRQKSGKDSSHAEEGKDEI